MMPYLLKSALLLAVLYGSFALLLSRETFHRFNRVALLFVLVASMVLPFIQLTIQKPEFLRYEKPEPVFVDLLPPTPAYPSGTQGSDRKESEHLQLDNKNGGIANPHHHNGRIANPSGQVANPIQQHKHVGSPLPWKGWGRLLYGSSDISSDIVME